MNVLGQLRSENTVDLQGTLKLHRKFEEVWHCRMFAYTHYFSVIGIVRL